jgi:hypothetical protein
MFLGARLRPGVFGWKRYALCFPNNGDSDGLVGSPAPKTTISQQVDLWTRPSFAEHFSILLVVSSCINFVVVYNVLHQTSNDIGT